MEPTINPEGHANGEQIVTPVWCIDWVRNDTTWV